jgi:oxaloacetate decarboxylase gamma subunit
MDTAVTEMLVEGVWLMVAGLAIVFGFLLVLVGVLMSMSWAVRRWGPAEPLVADGSTHGPVTRSEDEVRVAAVIAAAVAAHRRRAGR